MKRIYFGALALVLGFSATTTLPAQQMAQPTEGTRFGLGIGASLPMGDYGDVDKMGYNLLGVLQMPLASTPVHLRIDGLYSQTAHDGVSGSTDVLGGTVSALYHLGDRLGATRPYLLGGLGFFNVDRGVGGSETKIAFGFGGGVLFSLAGLNAFAEARYMSVQTSGSSVSFVPVSVGLMFGY
ncbi:MAG: outer membrane beta-barrel protein [Gemmatimonadales bacterium]|nr:outer membrane beta-barrel protein [Gemmatimonadales bacterium]